VAIPIVFLVSNSFSFSNGHHLTELEKGADGCFLYENEGQNGKVEKIGAISLNSMSKITNISYIFIPGPEQIM
jgi:hypothetical protein